MRRRRTSAAAVLAAALATGAFAAPSDARAASLDLDGGTLVYRADAGERNSLRIGHERGTTAIVVHDSGVPAIRRSGAVFNTCVPGGAANRLLCTRSLISALRVALGDKQDLFRTDEAVEVAVDAGAGDDHVGLVSVVADPFSDLRPLPSQVDVTGGAGRDLVSLSTLAVPAHLSPAVNGRGVTVTKDGRAGDGRLIDRNNVRPDVEALKGSAGDDVLVGSAGPDAFFSTTGEDSLHGLGGDDEFLMGSVKDGATRAVGGGGRDTASYAQRTQPVNVSADDPAFRDGEAGENDQLATVDVIEGGSGPDNMITPPGAVQGYRLAGGAGSDTLSTGSGPDRLIGGRGEDRLFSGGGADAIGARDGELDRVDCGTGLRDRADVDKLEREFRACENPFISF